MSGTDPGRRGLQELLGALRLRLCPFRALLIWSVSRLARETSIFYEILSAAKKAGVALVSVNGPVDQRFGDIILPLYGWQAQAQSDEINEDTKRAMASMIEQGYAPDGFPPQGLHGRPR